jgi:hypothetical protein
MMILSMLTIQLVDTSNLSILHSTFASCGGGLIIFGLKNENASKLMMTTETQT